MMVLLRFSVRISAHRGFFLFCEFFTPKNAWLTMFYTWIAGQWWGTHHSKETRTPCWNNQAAQHLGMCVSWKITHFLPVVNVWFACWNVSEQEDWHCEKRRSSQRIASQEQDWGQIPPFFWNFDRQKPEKIGYKKGEKVGKKVEKKVGKNGGKKGGKGEKAPPEKNY